MLIAKTMNKILFITLLFLISIGFGVSAQQTLTLSEAIETARRQSVDAAVALNELKTSYWEFRTYRADLLPEVNFKGTLPDYRRSYSLYQSEDGTYKYIRDNSLQMSGEISVDQNIWLPGGKLSMNSSLQFVSPLNMPGASR